MAKRSSLFEDLLEIAATLHWGVSLGLAAVSYLVLHWLADGFGAVRPAPLSPAELGVTARHQLFSSIAFFLQFVIALAFLLGAFVSIYRRSNRRRLYRRAGAEAYALAHGLSWLEFERVIGEAFRHRGYRVAERGGQGSDGGIDLILTRDGEQYLVQCKQWRAQKVGVSTVRELYGVMAARGVAGGIVVTCGEFTVAAIEFASGRDIQLMDGREVQSLLRTGVAAADVSQRVSILRSMDIEGTQRVKVIAPSCPKCGLPMQRRAARQGHFKGHAFWGCTGFPACRQTLPID